MRRNALMFLLTLVVSPAWADWVKVGVMEDGDADFYIDPATIRKDGSLRKVWELIDHKQRKMNGEMSYRSFVEYDCVAVRHRGLTLTTHSEPMAGGKILLMSLEAREWDYIAPKSVSESALKIVCSK